jgi:hypothetical protein
VLEGDKDQGRSHAESMFELDFEGQFHLVMWTLKTWVCTEQQIHKTRKKLLSVLQFWK